MEGFSSNEVASIDGEHGAGDVGGEGGTEEQRRGGDILGLAPAADRRPRHQLGVARWVGAERLRHWRVDPATGDCVDANRVLSEGVGQGTGEADEARLA